MASKRKAQAAPEPVLEEVEGTSGLNIDAGIIIGTFVLLVTALSMVWYFLDARYPGT